MFLSKRTPYNVVTRLARYVKEKPLEAILIATAGAAAGSTLGPHMGFIAGKAAAVTAGAIKLKLLASGLTGLTGAGASLATMASIQDTPITNAQDIQELLQQSDFTHQLKVSSLYDLLAPAIRTSIEDFALEHNWQYFEDRASKRIVLSQSQTKDDPFNSNSLILIDAQQIASNDKHLNTYSTMARLINHLEIYEVTLKSPEEHRHLLMNALQNHQVLAYTATDKVLDDEGNFFSYDNMEQRAIHM